MSKFVFKINAGLDRSLLASQFETSRRVQIQNILLPETALGLAAMLADETNWGIAWQAGADGPNYNKDILEIKSTSAQNWPEVQANIQTAINKALSSSEFGFQFASYPMLNAYLEQWNPGCVQDYVFEHINDAPFMNLVRQVTGIAELKKADAQATLYAPGHFLAQHDDSHVGQGWRVAYVLNLCPLDWRPDWGGYLNFLNEDGDIVWGWRPRFNTLNLFKVPQSHQVSFVPPFAPTARFAITGWFRDR
jgi:SM-20-related protein